MYNCVKLIEDLTTDEEFNEIQKRVIIGEFIKKEKLKSGNILVFIENKHIGFGFLNSYYNLKSFEYDGFSRKFITRLLPLFDDKIKIVLIKRRNEMKEKLFEWLTNLFNSEKVTVDENGQKTVTDVTLKESLEGLTIFEDLRDEPPEKIKLENIEGIDEIREKIRQISGLLEDVKWLKSLISKSDNITKDIEDFEIW